MLRPWVPVWGLAEDGKAEVDKGGEGKEGGKRKIASLLTTCPLPRSADGEQSSLESKISCPPGQGSL